MSDIGKIINDAHGIVAAGLDSLQHMTAEVREVLRALARLPKPPAAGTKVRLLYPNAPMVAVDSVVIFVGVASEGRVLFERLSQFGTIYEEVEKP